MTVVIKKDGWEVIGENENELEMGVLAVQRAIERAARKQPAPTTNGVHLGESMREIAERVTDAIVPGRAIQSRQRSLAMLKAIQNAGRSGARAEEMMKVTGAKHPKGTGSPTAALNLLLKEIGFDPPAVFDTYRVPKEGRVWEPRPKLAEAIGKLESIITQDICETML